MKELCLMQCAKIRLRKHSSVYFIVWMSTLLTTYCFGQCKQPISFNIVDKTTQSVSITWIDPNGSALEYEIELINKGEVRQEMPNIPNTIQTSVQINDLKPSTAYEMYTRTRCNDGQKSKWTGPINFITLLANPTACGTSIPLKDNGTETLLLNVEDNGIIGANLFIESIDLILAHGWPADMKIWIESPSGDKLTLVSHQGLLNDNYGNVLDTSCLEVTRFSASACDMITKSSPPFIGSFQPEGDMINFAINHNAKGIWKIHFLDRAVKDVGILKYFGINFTTTQCQAPTGQH
jgi:hypothetical protein